MSIMEVVKQIQNPMIIRWSIQFRMKKRGVTVSEIAARVRRGEEAVRQVIAGRNKTAEIRKAIAEALGTTPGRLWPKGS